MDAINSFPAFLLIFMRVGAFFATVPIFSYRNIPNVHKIGLAAFLSWIMLYALGAPEVAVNGEFILLVFKEALVGLSLGLIASILFYSIQVAGGFIDLQMGFAIAGVFDPQTGVQTPLLAKFLYQLALLFLLALNGHYLLLDGLFYSYSFVPLTDVHFGLGNGETARHAVSVVTAMFVIAFQMALPVVGTLFLVDLALGIVARTVPQINIFAVGLPLKILVAFGILLIILPVFFMSVQHLSDETAQAMRKLLMLLGE
ncbi:flagellar biosynthetic protein FliR [Fictibacillus enclensis]|uniref:Flagellar biosynthetic protein FliR n=1 Tax=Fictibacillus enclensis TaxID=1017270 RepID=A0A0V8JDI4_9BACL|nr:flagellar biosynthetic protein FliR [Fictibacillus enclensis]KSU85083.1 flagellar biosynthetic protein FliR [Fictibacillus enclensis]SCB90652.1 flagellar biosynthetic protein FliR [Fictibacillus enclensis]